MNVSGHRISTTEVESALVDHPAVAEAAVVGANDAVTGQAIMAYVIARGTHTASDELGEEVRQHVAKKLGAIARPKTVIFTDELPKTRSGKIMRRLLRDVAEGRSARRHHHARRPERGRGDQAPGGRVTDRRVIDLVHWHWRSGQVEPGPAVVFDMDGVLSDAGGRQHHLERPWRDWDAFFDAVGEDALITEVARLLDVHRSRAAHRAAHRPPHAASSGRRWRGSPQHELRWDLLVMRDWGDYGAARDFKRDAVHDLRTHGFDLRLAFEDDRRNVDMFHREGVPCVYIHSGYYD